MDSGILTAERSRVDGWEVTETVAKTGFGRRRGDRAGVRNAGERGNESGGGLGARNAQKGEGDSGNSRLGRGTRGAPGGAEKAVHVEVCFAAASGLSGRRWQLV